MFFSRRRQAQPLQPADTPTGERTPPPFVLEERLEEVRVSGAFTPKAALWLSPAFGKSGLLHHLTADELRLLLGVLSCLSPNGRFLATPERVAKALGTSPRIARQGLERLCEKHWQGTPLLSCHEAGNGLRFFAPSPHLFETRRSVISPAPAPGERVTAPEQGQPREERQAGTGGSRREEVVDRSRALYARPRAEVEAEIEAFLLSARAGGGQIKVRTPPAWETSPRPAQHPQAPALEEGQTPEEAATPQARQWLRLKRALVDVGVPHHRADELLDLYPFERIERQLEWLPLRQARNPVAYLLAAIEHDYAQPKGVRANEEPLPTALTQGGHDEA